MGSGSAVDVIAFSEHHLDVESGRVIHDPLCLCLESLRIPEDFFVSVRQNDDREVRGLSLNARCKDRECGHDDQEDEHCSASRTTPVGGARDPETHL